MADLPQLLNITLDYLGFEFKQVLCDTLEQDFGIRIFSAENIPLDELEYAFIDLFGEHASNLIMDILYKEAEKMRNQRMYRLNYR